ERDVDARDLAQQQRVRRRAERRIDGLPACPLEAVDLIEAAAADDAEYRSVVHAFLSVLRGSGAHNTARAPLRKVSSCDGRCCRVTRTSKRRVNSHGRRRAAKKSAAPA